MHKPLFICHGNLMRSQMAEGYYNHFTNSDHAISAGCSPFTPYRFNGPNKDAIAVMAEEGINIRQQKVKFITKEMAEEADGIYAMTFADEVPEYVLNTPKTIFWDIEDPWQMPINEVRTIRQQIKERILELVAMTNY